MFRNLLLSAFRHLWRHKLDGLINVGSLAIGLCVFAVAFVYVKRELTVDQYWPDVDRIHRLLVERRALPGSRDGRFDSVPADAYPALTDYFEGQIDAYSRISSLTTKLADSEGPISDVVYFVDRGFVDVFQLELLQGSFERALGAPGFLALEESQALKLGASGTLGSVITLESSFEKRQDFEIAAIYRLPKNVSATLTIKQFTLIHESYQTLFESGDGPLRSYRPNWTSSFPLWIKLKQGVDIDQFNGMQAEYVAKTVTAFDNSLAEGDSIEQHLSYSWQNVADMHFNPVGDNPQGYGVGNAGRVATFALVGLLVLLVGCSNSISLCLASALERRRETGIRKVAGALPADILQQSLVEALLLVLLSLALAIALTHQALPVLVALSPRTFAATPLTLLPEDYALLGLIAVCVGIAIAAYPAFLLARVKPEAALRPGVGGGRFASKGRLRSLLVGVQFCSASTLLIGTVALYAQLAVTRAQPLGFEVENLMMLQLTSQSRENGPALAIELERIPGVEAVQPQFYPPGMNMRLSSLQLIRRAGETALVETESLIVQLGFFELLNMELLAGRSFDRERDFPNAPGSVGSGEVFETRLIINRSATRALGFISPDAAVDERVYWPIFNRETGETIERPVRIIGVMDDNMFMSYSRLPGPQSYQLMPSQPGLLYFLKYEPAVESSILDAVQEVARRVNGTELNPIFLEDTVAGAFAQEKAESLILLVCGGVAMLLACIGLYGMAAFSVKRNIKEVGVRKALGSSSGGIVRLFLWRFSKPILWANLVAWPLALYFILQWIERFPHQIDKAWLLPICVATGTAVLLVALLTTGAITTRAALSKPVQSLRYE